jgi:hypothetical protein
VAFFDLLMVNQGCMVDFVPPVLYALDTSPLAKYLNGYVRPLELAIPNKKTGW